VQGDGKRDRVVDHVLRQSLTSASTSETAACIDAETLAAWADKGLQPAEAETVEEHVSNCARCTAVLATFVQARPGAPEAEPLWRRWRLAWAVPLATAATAIALWVAIPRNPTIPAAVSDSATLAHPAAPAPSEAPASTPSDSRARTQETYAAKAAPPASTAEKRERARPTVPPSAEPQIARADEAGRATATLVAPSAPAPPAATTLEADQKAADNQATGRAAARSEAPAPATGAEAPAKPAIRGFATRQSVAQVEIISPDPAIRWRVVGPGQIERSTTGGAQWEAASLPEASTITAGTSPAPSVCWLVGRTGAVYVTTDGLRFRRIAFPDRTDFISIRATDDRHATVITIDGRTFTTDDRGTTWTRVSQ